MGHKFAGLYSEEQDYRTYPQGSLASQLLGFVSDTGKGQYGIEQALNKQLTGTPGQLKAITDVNGVPLAASRGNVETQPKNGNNLYSPSISACRPRWRKSWPANTKRPNPRA